MRRSPPWLPNGDTSGRGVRKTPLLTAVERVRAMRFTVRCGCGCKTILPVVSRNGDIEVVGPWVEPTDHSPDDVANVMATLKAWLVAGEIVEIIPDDATVAVLC